MPWPRSLAVLSLLLALLLGSPLAALTITVSGLDGAHGVRGEIGMPGGDGGDGEDAEAVSESAESQNIARAQAGRGGDGGRGGSAFYGEIPPGPGGDGGIGGNATARAATNVRADSAEAEASATSGRGGRGGEGGHPWDTPIDPALEGDPGPGGSASAEAHATNASGSANARADATAGGSAGVAGAGSVRGREATALATATREGSSGSRRDPPRAWASSTAEAGGGGLLRGGEESQLAEARGGDATSEAHARGRGSTLTIGEASAIGGRGGFVDTTDGVRIGADGGDADARATAEGQGGGAVVVRAQAQGGPGGGSFEGTAGNPGVGRVTAFGRSLGGGSVDVEGLLYGGDAAYAYDADGGDAILSDAISGETAGFLTLSQAAFATSGFGGGVGGRGESVLHGSNPGGGAIDVRVQAAGGGGEIGGAGRASATAEGNGAARVDVTARAFGGEGASAGGEATLGEVFGRSPGGGDVHVIGSILAGYAGRYSSTPVPQRDATLVDAVDGETSGFLLLAQSATSFGGNAESRLAKTHAGSGLVVASEAEGASALAVGDATNLLGGAHVIVRAQGVAGGDAEADAHAASSADGATVRINAPVRGGSFISFGPFGAHAGSADRSGPGPGSATSRSVGEHTGDGEVVVFDEAFGGWAMGEGQEGGSARSEARASNAGRSLVAASATAGGGGSQAFPQHTGLAGGDADALAVATGGGETLAVARARAGVSDVLAASGRASAIAEASSPRARAGAEAITGDALAARVAAMASGDIRVLAVNGASSSAAASAGLADAYARALHSLDAAALGAALDTNPNVTAAFQGAQALACGEIGGGGASRLAFEGEVEIGPALLATSAFDQLVIGFLDPELGATASLRLTIEVDGQAVLKLKLKGPAGAASLDDRVVDLAVLPIDSLRIAIKMKTKDAASFAALDFVVGGSRGAGGVAFTAVPEPGAWLLLAVVALALRTCHTRSSRASASGVVTGSEQTVPRHR